MEVLNHALALRKKCWIRQWTIQDLNTDLQQLNIFTYRETREILFLVSEASGS